jgi:flavorubredoxin
MKAVEIKEGVYWVGAVDYNIRDFHGYRTPEGSTYNSYLVVDEKVALIDTVKSPFKDELLTRISSVIEPEKVDYLIVNHVEMDHSGSANAVMEKAKDAKVLCTERGKDFLQGHYSTSSTWDIDTVGSDDSLELGKRTLQFIPAPMLHWPDTMFTYSKHDRILFSNDGFGQHIATPNRFSDQERDRNIWEEAKKYYANILMPYGNMAKKKLKEIEDLNLEIEIICPSHGMIFREKGDIKKIISLYSEWAGGSAKEKAVIVFDTMYASTEKMARAIDDGLNNEGVETWFYNLRVSDITEIMSEILDAKAVIVGSSTLNNGPLPTVGGFLTYLHGLRPRGKIGAAFGSYGWGGGAVKTIMDHLEKSGMELPEEGFQIKFVPGPEVLNASRELGRKLAEHIKR